MSEQGKLELEGESEVVPKSDPSEVERLRQEKDALQTRLEAEKIERAKLEERTRQTPAAAPAKPPAPTIEQLQAAVDAGEITQAQMTAEIRRQVKEEIQSDLTREFEQKFTQREQHRTLKQQFDQYIALNPDVMKEGTEDRRRVQNEINDLVQNLGYTYDLRTEVLAMRNVFGPANRIPETTRQRRETHRDAGGAGGSSGDGATKEAKWEKGLNSGQITAFREQLSKGLYKGADDPFFQRVVTRARTANSAKGAA